MIRIKSLIVILCLLCACCRPVPPSEPDTLVLAFPFEPVNLNPVFLSDHLSFTVSAMIFNGLTRFTNDLRVAGDLAASWEVSGGGRRIVFFLRRGVKWHDGQEFTAHDVVFTYTMITSPHVPAPLKSQFGPVKAVRALDDYTVVVDYHEPFGSALESWSVGIIPRHLFEDRSITDHAFGRNPVGTGPYRVNEWLSGQRLVLESFPDHFAGQPRIKRLTLKIFADAATRFMELKAGRVDVMELTAAQFGVVQRNPGQWQDFALHRCPAVRYGFLGFNLQEPRWQDKRIRQALGQAIDKEGIIQAVLQGLGSPGVSPFPPGTYYCNNDLKPSPFDPLKAKATLQSLGFLPPPGQGQQAPPVTLITNYESRENLAAAEIIQQNFAALGLPIRIQTFDWLTFRHVVIEKRQFDLILLSRNFLWDPDLYPLWHSSQVRVGEWNFLSYHNPEVDRLLEMGRLTLGQPQRQSLYFKVQEYMAEDPPCIFLYSSDAVFIARKNIRGIQASPLEIFHNLAVWYLEDKDKK